VQTESTHTLDGGAEGGGPIVRNKLSFTRGSRAFQVPRLLLAKVEALAA
jgi:hypothetical protein